MSHPGHPVFAVVGDTAAAVVAVAAYFGAQVESIPAHLSDIAAAMAITWYVGRFLIVAYEWVKSWVK